MPSYPFHDVLFPETISYGSSGGPKFKTTIFQADSGYEQRNKDWSDVRHEFDVAQSIRSTEDMAELRAFFMARNGRAHGFRYKDWGDFQIKNQLIGVGDGLTKVFQIVKTYTSVGQGGTEFTYTRNIRKPKWDSIAGVKVGPVVQVSPTNYEVDYATGLMTFVTAPPADAPVTIGYGEFHVPVRFDTDFMDVTQEFWMRETWPNIPIIEIRDWQEVTTP
uniref:DUF2460 domain-containing protein n=1 Tax=Caulobacter phage BL57 TaxID=3348355 RepID=A0AB74UMN3_9VIRU